MTPAARELVADEVDREQHARNLAAAPLPG